MRKSLLLLVILSLSLILSQNLMNLKELNIILKEYKNEIDNINAVMPLLKTGKVIKYIDLGYTMKDIDETKTSNEELTSNIKDIKNRHSINKDKLENKIKSNEYDILYLKKEQNDLERDKPDVDELERNRLSKFTIIYKSSIKY